MVWSKAVKDSAGLDEFYQKNKNNYMWPERVELSLWDCADANEKENAVKYLSKNLSKGFDEQAFLAAVNKKNPSAITKLSQKLYVNGDDKNVDSFIWQNNEVIKGKHPLYVSFSEKQIAVVHAIVKPEPKKINEARGLITADYQNYLEKQWIIELRNKYPVTVNKELFNTIKP